jgi:DMSO/TMAO reductase YedYZ molybdopterin-dependent catalytic subunit
VALLSILKAAGVQTELNMGAKTDPKGKNDALRFAIVLHGRDGYVTVFSLGELLPDIGNKDAWVALDVDGKALPENEGPVRLIVPQDQMPARGVHELAEITVVNEAEAATQPSK